MSSPSDLGVRPIRDENGNIINYTVGRNVPPSNAEQSSGWVASRSFESGSVPTPDALSAMRAYTRARVKARRRMAEEDGVIIGGVVYDTSDDAHLRLMTLLTFAVRDPDYSASILIRDGTVHEVTSQGIYAVATAISNHMQACALWEAESMQTVEDAESAEELEAFEATIDDAAPAGDVTTPSAPEGTTPPPLYDDATFQNMTCISLTTSEHVDVGTTLDVAGTTALADRLDVTGPTALSNTLAVSAGTTLADTLAVNGAVMLSSTLDVSAAAVLANTLDVSGETTFKADVTITNANVDVTGSLNVTGDAEVARLYAHDRLGVGTMSINLNARARTERWLRAGSFLWRRGDRQPTKATAMFDVTSTKGRPAVLFFEVSRKVILGYAVASANGETVVNVTLGSTLSTADDDTVFEVELHIANATEQGYVALRNYHVCTTRVVDYGPA